MLRLPRDHHRLDEALGHLCHVVRRSGGRAWVVGGAVRDAVLGLPVADLDVEVHGLPADRLEEALASEFVIDPVGLSFGVLKLRGVPIDVSLPRRESKAGLGHRGFLVESDPYLEFPAAAARRDFTMNALAFDPLDHTLVDPFDGRADLQQGVLRHCSAAFVEDPLRVLRGMQFAARFDLRGHPDTLALCRTIEPEGLAAERIWQEWRKLLLLGRRPSAGLRFLREAGWLKFSPQLAALDGCPQDPEHHPEGDVYTHTGLCLDVFAHQRTGQEEDDLVVGLAVLCHDLGKPDTLERDADGRIRTPGHEQQSVIRAGEFLDSLACQHALARQILPLVACHGRPAQLYAEQASDAAVRRLSRDAGRIDRLVRVVRADQGGRGPAGDPDPPAARWLARRADELAVLDQGPAPIIMGRHLLGLGMQPGLGGAGHAGLLRGPAGGEFRDERAAWRSCGSGSPRRARTPRRGPGRPGTPRCTAAGHTGRRRAGGHAARTRSHGPPRVGRRGARGRRRGSGRRGCRRRTPRRSPRPRCRSGSAARCARGSWCPSAGHD
ncbi:MAG: polynucleotide adenylyltransferase [Candidatus Krumholzibacteriia bacterium]